MFHLQHEPKTQIQAGMWDVTNLQEEAWALWHDGQRCDGSDGRERAHQHKHSPAVKLVGWAHLETPAWLKGKGIYY